MKCVQIQRSQNIFLLPLSDYCFAFCFVLVVFVMFCIDDNPLFGFLDQ